MLLHATALYDWHNTRFSILAKSFTITYLFVACLNPPGPPVEAGVTFTPNVTIYAEGAGITYSCTTGTLSFSPAKNQCKNGAWLYRSPRCFSKL